MTTPSVPTVPVKKARIEIVFEAGNPIIKVENIELVNNMQVSNAIDQALRDVHRYRQRLVYADRVVRDTAPKVTTQTKQGDTHVR